MYRELIYFVFLNRALQTNIGELPQFSLDGMTINTLADLDAALAATRIEGDAGIKMKEFEKIVIFYYH